MLLEKQVVSLELAKKLKDLGVKQESLFYWNRPIFKENLSDMDELKYQSFYEENNGKGWYHYSAYTVAELGEILPICFEIDEVYHHLVCEPCDKGIRRWDINYMHYDDIGNRCFNKISSREDTEADARAEILIYLLKNNLLKL